MHYFLVNNVKINEVELSQRRHIIYRAIAVCILQHGFLVNIVNHVKLMRSN